MLFNVVNVIADQKVKDIVSEIKRGWRLAPREVSVLDARKVCTDITVSTVVLNCCKGERPSQWETTIVDTN